MSEEALRAALAEKRRALAALETEIAGLESRLGLASPLAPAAFPGIPPVPGVRLAAAAAAVKYRGRDDVMLAALDPGSVIAGTFTRSATRAAPVLACEDRLAALVGAEPGARAVLVNSGNANAFTGCDGAEAVARLSDAVGSALGIDPGGVFTASTGVIGEPLPDRADRRRARRPCRSALPRAVGGGGAGHHDHRHLSEGRERARGDRRGPRHGRGHRQGLGHDRAGHGDHAGLRLHRCRRRAAGAAVHGLGPHRGDLQRHHGGRRHLDLRHPSRRRHGAGGDGADHRPRRPEAERAARRAPRGDAGSRAPGRARRRGGDQAGPRSS